MEVGCKFERLIPMLVVTVLSAAVGALVGSAYNLAVGADRAVEKLRGAFWPPKLPAPERAGELALLLVSTASAVAGAFADAEELADFLAYFAAFLSSMSAAFFQNPLDLFPVLLALILRAAGAAE